MKVATVIAFFALASCSPSLAPDQNWANKTWVLYELNGVPVPTRGTGQDAHLQFNPATQRFSGSAGCNRIMGGYKIEGKDKITFGKAGTTLMACPDMALEQQFLQALELISRFETKDNTLLLKKDDEVRMRFR